MWARELYSNRKNRKRLTITHFLFAPSKLEIFFTLKTLLHLRDGFQPRCCIPLVLCHTSWRLQMVERFVVMWTIYVLDIRLSLQTLNTRTLIWWILWFFLIFLNWLWTQHLKVHQLLLNLGDLDVQIEPIIPLTITASRTFEEEGEMW